MDKTEARAVIKCLQQKDMTPEKTVALNCYGALLIQICLTFICSLKSNHAFLVASMQTICVVEEHLGNQDATHVGIAMHENRWTRCIDVKRDYIKNSEKLS